MYVYWTFGWIPNKKGSTHLMSDTESNVAIVFNVYLYIAKESK